MKKIILGVLLLSFCIGVGYFGYTYYQQNFKEWRVSDIAPGYRIVLKREVHEQIEQTKFKMFSERYWHQEKRKILKDIEKLTQQKVEAETNPKPSGEQGVAKYYESQSEAIDEDKLNEILPRNDTGEYNTDLLKSGDPETVQKVYMNWSRHLSKSFWDRQPEILQIRENELNYTQVEDSIFFIVYGRTPNTPLKCDFMGHDDKKLRITEVILFEKPPYQEEGEAGILLKDVKEIMCYPIKNT